MRLLDLLPLLGLFGVAHTAFAEEMNPPYQLTLLPSETGNTIRYRKGTNANHFHVDYEGPIEVTDSKEVIDVIELRDGYYLPHACSLKYEINDNQDGNPVEWEYKVKARALAVSGDPDKLAKWGMFVDCADSQSLT